MYVCNCAGVTQRELSRRLEQGSAGLKELRAERGLCQGCGKCTREVREALKHREQARRSSLERAQP